MKPRDPRPCPEATIQASIVDLMRFKGHKRLIFYHCPNGLPSSPRSVARFVRLGMRAGVPDLSLTLPDGRSAFLEVKRPGGRLSPEQKAFLEQCVVNGIPYAIVHSSEEAEQVLSGWAALREQRAAA